MFVKKLLMVLFVASLFFSTKLVVAQSGTGLTISPTIHEITLNKGETKTLEIQLQSQSEEALDVQFSAYDFSPNKDGAPEIELDKSTKNGIKSWINIASNTTVDTVAKTTSYTITAPDDIEDGTYYGVVLAKILSNSANELAASTGQLVLVQVGSPVYSSEIVDLTSNAELSISTLRGEASLEIANTGDHGFKPENLVLEIKDESGMSLSTLEPGAIGNILPNSTRIFKFEIDEEINPDLSYSIQASYNLPGNNEKIQATNELYIAIAPELPDDSVVNTQDEDNDNSNTLLFIIAAAIGLSIIIGVAVLIVNKRNKISTQQTTAPLEQTMTTQQVINPENQTQPQNNIANENTKKNQPSNNDFMNK